MAITDRLARGGHHRGLTVGMIALVVGLMAMGMGMRADPVSSPDAAAAWVERERPAGSVLTIEGWGASVGAGGRLRVVTAVPEEFGRTAASADPGSAVVPTALGLVEELRATGEWTVTFSDGDATVLVRDGALPVAGAT